MLDPADRPLPRHIYNSLLRTAIKEAIPDRDVVTLDQVAQLLPQHFEHQLPGRPALARIMQTMGWSRISTTSGPAFASPKTTEAIGTVN